MMELKYCLDEIDTDVVDEKGLEYRDSEYSQQMTEDTFNQIFGSEEQEPG